MVADRCPKAVRCADPFHVVKWATEALDEVRRQGLEHRPWRGHPTPRRPRHRPGEGVEACPLRAVEEPGGAPRGAITPGGDERTPPPTCRSRPGEAEGSLTVEMRGRVGAALTTTGHTGTARRCGSGKQDETPYERNQCLTPRNSSTGSNLADLGRHAVRAADSLVRRRLRDGIERPVTEATLKACGVGVARLSGYSWAARSSTGVVVNVGSGLVPPVSPSGEGQAHRRLMAPDRGGGLVVVRVRERRAHGEGDQQVSNRSTGRPGGTRR